MKKLLIVVLLSSMPHGCSTPGLRIGAEVTLPPTIHNASPMTPIPALPTTAYMVETQQPPPTFSRQYAVAAAPQMPYAPPPVSPFPTRAEQLPMPQAGPCKSPCQ